MHATVRDSLIGFVLAVILTIIPFAAVAIGPAPSLVWVILGAALVQVLVHLRFFLGIRLHGGDDANRAALVFAAIVIFIMVGGTLWVMFNLNMRMHY